MPKLEVHFLQWSETKMNELKYEMQLLDVMKKASMLGVNPQVNFILGSKSSNKVDSTKSHKAYMKEKKSCMWPLFVFP